MKIDVSIITVGYKSEKRVGPFLNSILKKKDKTIVEVIFVNNYPLDKAVAIAKKHPLNPIVIENTENLGFSKAINMGIKVAKGEFILIINPDTRLVGDALSKLVKFARSKDQLGAIAPRLLNNDGSIQASCYKFPNITNAIRQNFLGHKFSYKKYNPGDTISVVDVAVMAAMLIPRKTIDLVGGLDERFFLYYEDVEYCRRLSKYGLPIYYYPDAKVKHEHGVSGNFTSHLKSPLLNSAKTYYGSTYFFFLNLVLWIGHKWQVILRGQRFRD